MKRFKIVERYEKKMKDERKEEISEIVILKDEKTNRVIKLENVAEWVWYLGDRDFDAVIKLYIDDKEPIYYDPISRKWEWKHGTRGQNRRAYASICRYLGIPKKQLPTYLGLVSLFD